MRPTTLFFAVCFMACAVMAQDLKFAFKLDKPAITTAGIFDSQGLLVRVLWNRVELPGLPQSASWDGKDDNGLDLAPGSYTFKVVINRATYDNVGAIGNSGRKPNDKEHTPTNIESVAVDAAGNVYTANHWDESGADFKSWDPQGNSRYDAQYQIRNGRPNGAPYAIAVDDQYLYCAVDGWDYEPWNNRQQIQRFKLTDGKRVAFSGRSVDSPREKPRGDSKPQRVPTGQAETLIDGHIQVYEWPRLQIKASATEAEAHYLSRPLRAIAVHGDTLYVADALGNKIRMYNKETGQPTGDLKINFPHALAVDKDGVIWVGHEGSRITAFNTDGSVASRFTQEGEITSLCFGPGNTLYVSNGVVGNVQMLDVSQKPPIFKRVLGQKARPGDRDADRFYTLRGVAVDAKGNLVTVNREPGPCGVRLAHWSPDGKLHWEHFATEFVSLGNYGVGDPDTLYTMSHHRHRLLDRARGTWEYLGYAGEESATKYRSDPHGVIRVRRIDKSDFVFMPMGDGVQIYRAQGPVLKLCAMVGGNDPDRWGDRRKSPLAKWAWSDQSGSGKPIPEEIKYYSGASDGYSCFGMDVDAKAAIWFANTKTKSIWTIPLNGLDGRGNPVYDWNKAREVVSKDDSALGFDPTMAQAADDGTIYAFGWSKRWPSPKDNPFWMGGTTLCRFDAKGKRLWAVKLPQVCVGLDVIPGGAGGCIAGRGKDAHLYHFTADGLWIGQFQPGEAMSKQSGWLDNHASVAVNRDPRDGRIDVFTEDDYVLRIGWYRFDDKAIETLSGAVEKK